MSNKHLPSKKFQKKVEDFVCGNCEHKTKGTGFTNHCPKCLFSKHVDINPGDRAEECGGLMEPVNVEQKHGEVVLVQRCQKCGVTKKVKMDKGDDYEEVLRVLKNRLTK